MLIDGYKEFGIEPSGEFKALEFIAKFVSNMTKISYYLGDHCSYIIILYML